MTKLFLISLRWLKNDKKRTLLTFLSITLAVYLVTFIGYYMSTAVGFFRSEIAYSNGRYHLSVPCSEEQADIMAKNTVFDETAFVTGADSMYTKDFVDRYFMRCSDSAEYFPSVKLNGMEMLENGNIETAACKGDAAELLPADVLSITDGRLPEREGEVMLNSTMAATLGLTTGDELVMTYSVYKGKFYYVPREEGLTEEEYRDESGELRWQQGGGMLQRIYSNIRSGSGDPWELSTFFTNALFAKSNRFRDDDNFSIYGHEMEIGADIVAFKAEYTGEPVETHEYRAKITGIGSMSERTILFWPSDPEYNTYATDSGMAGDSFDEPRMLVRVKEGLDAEQEFRSAAKHARINLGEDIMYPTYSINANLLIFEGRQLEYIANVGAVMLLAVIIMSIFVFLARLIINNAFEISAAYRTEQYGALKTIGASDGQIFAMTIFECAVYSIVALPLGTALSMLTGRFVLDKLLAIKIFDPIFGDGISDTLFKLEISPTIMAISVFIALFSVFFSAYADAMRVKRMPPIQSMAYKAGVMRRGRKKLWLSRRFFGMSYGMAMRSIGRQKVRFLVTLLATAMSGVILVGLTSFMDFIKSWDKDYIDADMVCYYENDTGDEPLDVKEKYDYLHNSGLFDEINMSGISLAFDDLEPNKGVFSEEYEKLHDEDFRYDGLWVSIVPIGRDEYAALDAPMSYDELVKTGKPLFSNDLGVAIDKYEQLKQEDWYTAEKLDSAEALNTDPLFNRYKGKVFAGDTPTLTANVVISVPKKWYEDDEIITDEGDTSETVENVIQSAGVYTTDNWYYMSMEPSIMAVIPMENYAGYIASLPAVKYVREADETDGNRREIMLFGGFFTQAELRVKEGRSKDAQTFLETDLGGSGYFENRQTHLQTMRNISAAVNVAGYALTFVLLAVSALNIVSTMSANMINRRKEFFMLRSCGMTMKQVFMTLFHEGMVYALVTGLLCTVAGTEVNILLSGMMISETPVLSMIPWAVIGVIFIGVLGLTLGTFAPSLLSMKRSPISEEIRSE